MADKTDPSDSAALRGAVPPALPLALLESVRAHDRPGEVLEEEDVTISLPRRFGLKGVVQTQIQRYEDARRAGRGVPGEEWLNLVRLVLRRPDADAVLRVTGERLTHWYFRGPRAATAPMVRTLPQSLRFAAIRRSSLRLFRRLGGGGKAVIVSKPLALRLDPAPPALFASNDAVCALYTGALDELLRLYTGNGGVVRHERCTARGDDLCLWSLSG